MGGRGPGRASSASAACSCWRARTGIPGVVGIVASRIVERYHRPAVVIALDGDGWAGDRRGASPASTCWARSHASAEHLERYGGHRAAAGLTIHRERLEALRSDARAVTPSAVLTPTSCWRQSSAIDAIVSGSRARAWRWPRSSSGSSRPGWATRRSRLLVPGARFATCGRWGRGATRGSWSAPAGRARPAVAFGCDGQVAGRAGRARRRDLPARAQLLERHGRAAARAAAARGPARPRDRGARRARATTWCGDRGARRPTARRPAGTVTARRRAGRCSTAAARARWRCLPTRSPAAGARCSPCAPTSAGGCAGLGARIGGFA